MSFWIAQKKEQQIGIRKNISCIYKYQNQQISIKMAQGGTGDLLVVGHLLFDPHPAM